MCGVRKVVAERLGAATVLIEERSAAIRNTPRRSTLPQRNASAPGREDSQRFVEIRRIRDEHKQRQTSNFKRAASHDVPCAACAHETSATGRTTSRRTPLRVPSPGASRRSHAELTQVVIAVAISERAPTTPGHGAEDRMRRPRKVARARGKAVHARNEGLDLAIERFGSS